MTWFAFSGLNNGKAVDLAGTQEKQAVSEGFHGYSTEAQAEQQPNSVNFLTKVFANGWISDYNAAVKENAQPGGTNASNPIGAATAGATSTLESGIIDALKSIPILNALTSANLWVRVAKVILGGGLLLVGVVKLTGTDTAAGKIVKTAVKQKIPGAAPYL